MPHFKLIALSNPVSGSENDFNIWYDEQHLGDVCAVPGITGAQRLKFCTGNDRWRYLAIYDVEVDDPASVLPEIQRRAQTGLMPISSAFNPDDVYFGIFGVLD